MILVYSINSTLMPSNLETFVDFVLQDNYNRFTGMILGYIIRILKAFKFGYM